MNVVNARLRKLYDHVSIHATADREHEASLELLLLMMVADHHITEDEIDAIRAISEDSGWDTSTFSFDQGVGPAMATVRAAVSDHRVDALLDDICDRISSTVLRSTLFSAARDIAGVDHEIDPAEESLLAQIAVRFA